MSISKGSKPHRRRLQAQVFAGDGVLEAQLPGVEPEAVRGTAAVEAVPEDGPLQMGEVDADLVSAARVDAGHDPVAGDEARGFLRGGRAEIRAGGFGIDEVAAGGAGSIIGAAEAAGVGRRLVRLRSIALRASSRSLLWSSRRCSSRVCWLCLSSRSSIRRCSPKRVASSRASA